MEEEYIQITIQLPILKQPLSISIPQQHTNNSSLKAIAYSLCHQHNIPPYYTLPILSTLTTTCQQLNLSSISPPHPLSSPTNQKQQTRQDFINKYQDNTIQYHIKPEEDEFPRAFSTLIKSPIASIFDALLKLDQSYTLYINDLLNKHHQALITLQTRQAQEMDSSLIQQQQTTQLFAKHVEEMEIMQATFASDILQTHQSQRQEYRDFVMELYREYQLRLSQYKTNQQDVMTMIDGKELVDLAASRTWKKSEFSSNSTTSSTNSSSSSIHSTTSSTHSPSSIQKRSRQGSTSSHHHHRLSFTQQHPSSQNDPQLIKMIKSIQEMGFTKEQAETALFLTNKQSLESAIQMLIENSKQVDDYIDQQQQQSKRKSTSSLSSLQDNDNTNYNSRRHSLQKLISPTSTPPPPPPPPPSSSSLLTNQKTNPMTNGKSWNPISFLQQQKQAMENTNLSSVRKLGGWLGKAMENLGIEHDENDPTRFVSSSSNQPSQLVESFTITLGTAQIKTTHNLRLMVADVAADLVDPLPFDEQKELAYKAQTTMRLYTNQLCALIVLVEKKELMQQQQQYYLTGKGSNKSLFDRCQRSTEFHFPSMNQQLDTIEKDIKDHPDVLKEGSFFITRHSNLPLNQIVFHLIIDSDAILQTELSNRHPLMNGLRNILRLTYKYDISSISIPLFLLPDQYLEQPEHYMPSTIDHPQQHSNWLSKRSDVLMKTVKAYLMESSRGKNDMYHDRTDSSVIGSSGLRNIEFFIPMQQKVYIHDPTVTTTSTSITSFPLTSSSTSSLPSTSPSSTLHNNNNNNINNNSDTTNLSHQHVNNINTNNDNNSNGISNPSTSSTATPLTINTNNNMSSSSLSLSLPSTPTTTSHHHPSLIPTPQVEQIFQQLRTLLVNIFRTS